MVLLPAIYAGLIVLVVYGVYYHAVNHVGMLSGGWIWFRVVGYVTPIAVGGILVLFMVKPFFARKHEVSSGRTLDRQQEPLLGAIPSTTPRAR